MLHEDDEALAVIRVSSAQILGGVHEEMVRNEYLRNYNKVKRDMERGSTTTRLIASGTHRYNRKEYKAIRP